jgi:hypothetical protein
MNKRRLTLLVTMIVIVLSGCWEERAGTTCPIDGQPPQWRGQGAVPLANSSTTATWNVRRDSCWADCELADKSLERK